MRVLLIPPKNNYPDPMPKVNIYGQGFPYIAGALKKAGHEVFAINIGHQWCNGSAPAKLATLVQKAIEEYQPHFIGVGGLSGDYPFIRDAVRFIRHSTSDIPIICGGGIVTYDREYIFTNLRPDFAVTGEAEETIVAFADYIERGGDIADIANIAYWGNGRPIYNRIEYSNAKLEDLPFPDYDPFDFERFLECFYQTDAFYTHSRLRPRIMPITFGRSCPFKCTFCCHTRGPKYRERSIDNGIEEIIYFYNRYHFNILLLYDELFSRSKGRVREFCTKIKKLKVDLGIDFDWTCDLRVANVDRDLLTEMKEAGCIFIGYGLESASPKVLKSMKKGTRVDQIERAIKLTDEVGIGVQGSFIFGDIAETPETAQETVDFFNKYCRDLMVSLSHIVPYPGSEIFQYCLDNGIITDKQCYYEEMILSFGSYKINMTEMLDRVFLKIINKIERAMDSVESVRKLKNSSIVSCEKIDGFADLEAPLSLRRKLYKIKVMCPHCRELVEYLCSLSIIKSDYLEFLRTYCTSCHKSFMIFPQEKFSIRDNLKKITLRLAPYFVCIALIRIYSMLLSIKRLMGIRRK